MYLFRGEAPVAEMAEMFPGIMKTGIKLVGGRFFKEYPFEEAYFLPYARQFRAALSMPLVLLGGINRLDTITARARRRLRVRADRPRAPARTRAPARDAKGPETRFPLHPLQQVHAHDLYGHALRVGVNGLAASRT